MTKVAVNPEILRWARETAGLEVDVAAKKIALGDLKDVSAGDRLTAMEAGIESPSRPLLVRMAKQYRRPLITFYMENPPTKGDRGQDFRRLPPDHPIEPNAWLDTLVRDALARQSLVRSVLEDEDEAVDHPFVGSLSIDAGTKSFVDSISKALQFDLDGFRTQKNVTEAFAWLRAKAEVAGIFVILRGDLGNYRTAIDLQTFRGFALADRIAPFVVINDNDARSAWAFTLLHEITHLWLGQTGVSGAHADIAVEKFCNDVAGEMLLPQAELQNLVFSEPRDFEVAVSEIGDFATTRRVSRSMVAYKLFRRQRIGQELWVRLRDRFRADWIAMRDSQRKKNKESGDNGPSYFVVRRHRVGDRLINLVERMMSAGAMSTTKAGIVLGVRPLNVHKLVRGKLAA